LSQTTAGSAAVTVGATAVAHVAGARDVVVTTAGGAGTLTNGFTSNAVSFPTSAAEPMGCGAVHI
jgi:hypothetical protein